jgi:hypothetical protein
MQTQRRRPRCRCFGQVLVSAGFACVCVVTAATLHAQDRSGAVQLRAGAALGLARTSVGGGTSTDVGPLLTGQLGCRGVDPDQSDSGDRRPTVQGA